MHFTGIVLAGGRSSRFGSDKGLFPFRGKPLVEHAIDILRSNFSDIRISTNQPEAYSYLELPMIGDIHPGCGPLGGLHAALLFERERMSEGVRERRRDEGQDLACSDLPQRDGCSDRTWPVNDAMGRPGDRARGIAVISCDTPMVPPEMYTMLLENLDDFQAVVPVHGDFKETTCAIYTDKCLPFFEKAIREHRYKILDALISLRVEHLEVMNTPFYLPEMFHNINSMDDTKDY